MTFQKKPGGLVWYVDRPAVHCCTAGQVGQWCTVLGGVPGVMGGGGNGGNGCRVPWCIGAGRTEEEPRKNHGNWSRYPPSDPSKTVYGTVLFCTVLHCSVLHCIEPLFPWCLEHGLVRNVPY